MKAIKEQLQKMKLGQIEDVIFSNGLRRVTREIEKIEENVFYMHDFGSGWLTAELDLKEAVKFCKGEIKPLDLLWE